MANNISGGGFLSGLGSFTTAVTNAFTLLASRILGFTYGPGGGSSYYTTTSGKVNSGVIAIGSYGNVAKTNDGVNWSVSNGLFDVFGETNWRNEAVVYSEEFKLWVAASQDGRMVSSVDGLTWTENVNLPISVTEMFLLKSSGGGDIFFALERNGSGSAFSADGINWTITDLPTGLITYSDPIQSPISVTGVYLISDNSGKIYQSSNFLYWNLIDNLTEQFGAQGYLPIVAAENYVYMQPSNRNNNDSRDIYFSSSGGYEWQSYNTGAVYYLETVQYISSSQQYVVATSDGPRRSTNGFEWSGAYVEGGGFPSVEGLSNFLVLGNRLFSLMRDSNHAYITSSADGISYVQPTNLDIASDSPFIGYTGTTYVVIDTTGRTRYSTDGVAWTESSTSLLQKRESNWNKLVSKGNKVIAFNVYGYASSSTDGINWTDPANLGSNSGSWHGDLGRGELDTFVEIQVSIGNQGEEGAEILAPVDVYTVPAGKLVTLQKISLQNTETYALTYDLGLLSPDEILSQASSIKFDELLLGNTTSDLVRTDVLLVNDRVTVLPSTVDALDVKVYGVAVDVLADMDSSSINGYIGVYTNTDFLSIEIFSTIQPSGWGLNEQLLIGKSVYTKGFSAVDSMLVDGYYRITRFDSSYNSGNGQYRIQVDINFDSIAGINITTPAYLSNNAPKFSYAIIN